MREKHAPLGIYEEAFLFQAEGNKLAKFVGSFTDRTTAGNTSGWDLGKHGCLGMDKDDNFLLYSKVVVEKGYFDGGEDCYKIHSWWVTKDSDELSASIWNQFIRYLDRKNIQRPQEAVMVSFTRTLEKRAFSVYYGFNPEVDGDLTRSQNRNWQKTRYFHDKKKDSYIKEKKQWAERWRLKVADGIKGKLPVQPMQSVSDRLVKLQQLLDDGVISKQDFEKKKAGILDAL